MLSCKHQGKKVAVPKKQSFTILLYVLITAFTVLWLQYELIWFRILHINLLAIEHILIIDDCVLAYWASSIIPSIYFYYISIWTSVSQWWYLIILRFMDMFFTILPKSRTLYLIIHCRFVVPLVFVYTMNCTAAVLPHASSLVLLSRLRCSEGSYWFWADRMNAKSGWRDEEWIVKGLCFCVVVGRWMASVHPLITLLSWCQRYNTHGYTGGRKETIGNIHNNIWGRQSYVGFQFQSILDFPLAFLLPKDTKKMHEESEHQSKGNQFCNCCNSLTYTNIDPEMKNKKS